MSAYRNIVPTNGAPKSASLAGSEPQLLYRVRDAAKVLGLSERKVWDLLTRRELTASRSMAPRESRDPSCSDSLRNFEIHRSQHRRKENQHGPNNRCYPATHRGFRRKANSPDTRGAQEPEHQTLSSKRSGICGSDATCAPTRCGGRLPAN
jgi:hypothetical protein